MTKKTLIPLMIVFCLFSSNVFAQWNKKDKEIIDKVAQWQMDNHHVSKHHKLDWTNGALYRGMVEWAEYTDNESIYNFLLAIGNQNDWQLRERVYHADDLTVAQTYIKLYEKYKNPKMIEATKERLNYVVNNPSQARLLTENTKSKERWSWSDALFMAPPVYVAMNKIHANDKYLKFVDKEFTECTDSLFDKKERLYYRDSRFITKRETNGAKVFWGRGNGWVFAGLPLLINELPKEHPTYNYYIDIYKEMAIAMVETQDKKGSWHANLLAPNLYPAPENSASGFIIYGLAWGVNNGILTDKKYKNAAKKGWKTLKSHVHIDGKLGFVQPVSADPGKVTEDMTEVYGVGAFLLAGMEMQKLK